MGWTSLRVFSKLPLAVRTKKSSNSTLCWVMDLPSKHQAGQSRWLHHGALPSACQISRSGRGGKEPPTRWPHAGRKHHMIVGSPELQCGLEEGSWHPCQCQSYCLLPFETYKLSSRSAMEKERAQWWGVWLWFTHTRTHAHTCTHAHTRTHTHTHPRKACSSTPCTTIVIGTYDHSKKSFFY